MGWLRCTLSNPSKKPNAELSWRDEEKALVSVEGLGVSRVGRSHVLSISITFMYSLCAGLEGFACQKKASSLPGAAHGPVTFKAETKVHGAASVVLALLASGNELFDSHKSSFRLNSPTKAFLTSSHQCYYFPTVSVGLFLCLV